MIFIKNECLKIEQNNKRHENTCVLCNWTNPLYSSENLIFQIQINRR